MKKILILLVSAGLLMSCHIGTEEPTPPVETSAYEAYGVLTVLSSGFTKENVRTKVVLVSDDVLDIYMFDVKFATMMPVTIDMLISGVAYAHDGPNIVFTGDSIVPTAGGKPYERFIVRDLVGTVTADSLLITNSYGDTPSEYAGALVQEP